MSRKRKKLPSYRLHKRSGQAVVTLNGKDCYLGLYNSPESRSHYEQLMAQWLTGHRQVRSNENANVDTGLTINEVFLAYWGHVQVHYRKNGRPTSQIGLVKLATRPLLEFYGGSPIATFGPMGLKTVRERMIQEDISLSPTSAVIG